MNRKGDDYKRVGLAAICLAQCLPFELGMLQPAVSLLLLREVTWGLHYELATASVAIDENERYAARIL